MRNYILLCTTLVVFATVGCEHAQRLQWHLPQLEIDGGGIGFYVPFPTLKDEGAYESPFKVQAVQKTEATGYNHPLPEWKTTEGYESKLILDSADWDLAAN